MTASSSASTGKVAFLVAAEGIERVELTHPWAAVRDAGLTPVLVSVKPGEVQTFDHLDKAETIAVDEVVAAVAPDDFDALVLPGGVANPDALRMDATAVAFVKAFVGTGKPVAAICHAPWVLIEAGVLAGRKLTSWPSGVQRRAAVGVGARLTAWVGTSGWSYDHWTDVLYPPGLAPRDRLAAYVAQFRTVELNASFYRWPRDAAFASWRRRLPEGFVMTVKGPRGLTHARRLYAPEVWCERIERCWHILGDRRGVLLLQLPPTMERDDVRLDYALSRLPCVLRATAPFVYARLLYGGSYSDADLDWWADRIREWECDGREVFAYFNNDGGGNAVHNARALRHRRGQ